MILSIGLCLAALVPQDEPQGPVLRTQPWPESVVALAESLPVQDGGRVKPLSTYASFTQASGKAYWHRRSRIASPASWPSGQQLLTSSPRRAAKACLTCSRECMPPTTGSWCATPARQS